MAFMKKNIWLAFYMILFFWTFFGCISVYLMTKNVHKEYINKQENITSISADSLKTVLKKYEVILDILAQQLLDKNIYLNKELSENLINIFTKIDPTISMVDIFNSDGIVYIMKTNEHMNYDLPLLEKNDTKDSFIKTLESSGMVIGRTYTLKDAGEDIEIIPLRKAVRGSDGNVKFVLSFSINARHALSFFVNNAFSNNEYTTYLYRETDRYFQFASQNMLASNIGLYDYKIPELVIEKSIETLMSQVNISYEKIKEEEIMVSSFSSLSPQGERLLTSVYIERYELWLTTYINSNEIYRNIFYKIIQLFLIYLGSLFIIYKLFRYIDNIEKIKENKLFYQATHDYLTDLKNRFHFESEIKSKNRAKPFWLILIDVDNFKSINTSHGHESGDFALKKISARLNEIIEDDDVLIRYGGNEFIVISYNKELEAIRIFCDDILRCLRESYSFNWGDFIFTASIGVAHYPSDSKDLDEIRQYAGLAMNEAKKTRNITTFYQEKIKDSQISNFAMLQELKYGVERNEFYMLYQPKVNITGSLLGVEALIRWENKTLGFLTPDKFINIAETSGDMIEIGSFVILRSLSDIAYVNSYLTDRISLSINISVVQLLKNNFLDILTDYIIETEFDPNYLIIEITETLFIKDIFGMKDTLDKIRKMGIKISLDDFGTGYSSLNLLTKLPVDEIKIDKSFVDDIQHDVNARSMAEGIITIGKKLGFMIVAEGVETKEQLHELTIMGCDVYQGYYFAKPLSLENLKEYAISNQ